MQISTFELLLNATQLPREVQGVDTSKLDVFKPLSRNVIQGYFLTISNLEEKAIKFEIQFCVVTSQNEDPFNNSVVSSFFDSDGRNQTPTFRNVNAVTRSLTLKLKPKDTGLLLVQPNPFLIQDPLNTSEIEIRGYTEIKATTPDSFSVLITPEQRGTFYELCIPKKTGKIDRNANVIIPTGQQLDQTAYSLPTSTGGSLFKVTQ